MTRRTHSELTFIVATVLVGLLFAVLPLHAADSVHIEAAADEQPAFTPDIMNGLITSDYPTVGVILEGPSMDNNYQFCTGTLIGCNTFLTAAHCLCANNAFCDDHDVSTGWVYFPNGGVYGVSDVHIHPDFLFPVADVAIVTLSEPVTGITPSRINDVGPVEPGTRGTIVGYGLSDLQRWSQGVKRSGKRSRRCRAVTGSPTRPRCAGTMWHRSVRRAKTPTPVSGTRAVRCSWTWPSRELRSRTSWWRE